VLQSPPNLGFEAELSRHLPGARFVMLHRDPVEVIPSTVAIVRELRRLYGESAGDLRKVGAWAIEEYSGAMERHLAWRATAPAGSVMDIAYTELRDHYEQVVERVYGFCGMPLTNAARERMSGWAGDNEQHKHGVHQYSLEESGLSPELIRARFAPYLKTYGKYLAGE
jgi:Sulfotransferase family